MQRQEKSTPFKPHPLPHPTATKRSLCRDLENQFLASRRISDTDSDSSSISQENRDPVSCTTPSEQCKSPTSVESVATEPLKSGQVSVIRKAPSALSVLQSSDKLQSQKRPGCLLEICDNQLTANPCASPEKLPHKQAEQEARYASALALIQLANGYS